MNDLEIPIGIGDVTPGQKVIVATYSFENAPTKYEYGVVETVSKQGNVVNIVGGEAYETKTGYLFTSRRDEKFRQRLLRVTDSLVAHIQKQDAMLAESVRRHELLQVVRTTQWELLPMPVLEAVCATLKTVSASQA